MAKQTNGYALNSSGTMQAALPWYREPWPWLLAAIPFLTVVAGAVTFSLAVSSSDSLVADDYYKRGLDINRVLAREQAANRLGIEVRLRFARAEDRVVAVLASSAAPPSALVLRLSHPTRMELDTSVVLQPVAPGTYAGKLHLTPAARWQLAIEDPEASWRRVGTWSANDVELLLQNATPAE